jgi:preprotein translocase SecE subunit
MWEETIENELEPEPALAPPLGPPRTPRTAIGALDNFFADIRFELSRITWPPFTEVAIMMAVVVSIVFCTSVYVSGLDHVLSALGRLTRSLWELF